MGLLTPLAVKIGSIPWMPKLLPQIVAVDKALQGKGIGRELVRRTQTAIGDEVSLILLSAAGAMSYYPEVGFQKADNAFVIRRKR